MELSLLGTYAYMLMVVVMFTSPITITLLIVGYFKGFLLRAFQGVLVALPLLALVVQLSFYLGNQAESARYDSDRTTLQTMFPLTDRQRLITGYVAGYETVGKYTYTRYQFELSNDDGQVLDILVPPTTVTSAATVTFADPLQGEDIAQLYLGEITNGPKGMTPREFISTHHPELTGEVISENILFLQLFPRQSSLRYFSSDDVRYPWRSQVAILRLDGLVSY